MMLNIFVETDSLIK